jgi:hypothetical protein
MEFWVNPTALTTIHGAIGTFGAANGKKRLWIGIGGAGIPLDQLMVNLGSCCTSDMVVPSPLDPGAWTPLALPFDYTRHYRR